jgi:hypothetical protein
VNEVAPDGRYEGVETTGPLPQTVPLIAGITAREFPTLARDIMILGKVSIAVGLECRLGNGAE